MQTQVVSYSELIKLNINRYLNSNSTSIVENFRNRFMALGVRWQGYIRLINSKRSIVVSPYHDWLKHMHDCIDQYDTITENYLPIQAGISVISGKKLKIEKLKFVSDASNYGLNNPMYLVLANSTLSFVEIFTFGTCFNTLESTFKFINNFNKLNNLINQFHIETENSFWKFQINNIEKLNIETPKNIESKKANKIEKYSAKKYYFGYPFGDSYFTEKEYAVLKYIFYGKPLKYIAHELNISPRTVEAHLLNIKVKANSENLLVLNEKLNNCPLFISLMQSCSNSFPDFFI